MRTGLDVLVSEQFSRLGGLKLGVLCHQASIASDYGHIVDHMLRAGCDVRRLFGPQHGPWGHTQDNMVEWSGFTDHRTGIETVSLYGDHREPTPDSLERLDLLVIDLQDVGCRVYTFIWTMELCMRACKSAGVSVTVLDRPNPIGQSKEGPVLSAGFESFVGLHPLPMRHGQTIGELSRLFADCYHPGLELEVVGCQESESEVPWVSPSPNMPTLDTALVYPGMVLLEGTNLSEGRGTTRPFETFGAPWLDSQSLCDALNSERLPGALFRPVSFQPTFQKHRGELCHGGFIHVTDPGSFQPVLTGIAVLQHCRSQVPGRFEWKLPPYEYEERLLPIDILAGNSWVRHDVEANTPLSEVRRRAAEELRAVPPCQGCA